MRIHDSKFIMRVMAALAIQPESRSDRDRDGLTASHEPASESRLWPATVKKPALITQPEPEASITEVTELLT